MKTNSNTYIPNSPKQELRSLLSDTPRSFKIASVFIFAVTVFIIAVSVFALVLGNVRGVASGCVVTDKDRTSTSDGSSDMRVYTSNCGVFIIGDNVFTGTFDSADIYSNIEVGKTYDFKVTGKRISPLSVFPSIYEYELAGN